LTIHFSKEKEVG